VQGAQLCKQVPKQQAAKAIKAAAECIRRKKRLIGANNIPNNRTRRMAYEQFEHAYKTGYNSFFKYPGEDFDDVEDDVALGYEQAKPGSALPWDTVRPAVNAVWDRLGGIISPRDPSRGVREWL
jgi:hypothetical protein